MPNTFTGSPAFTMRYYAEFGNENASTADTIAYETAIKTIFPEETTVNTPLGHLAAMLLANQMAGDSRVSVSDLITRYGQDVFTEDFLYQQIVGKTGLGEVYWLLSGDAADYGEEERFIRQAIAYWNSLEEYTQEDFDLWLYENSAQIREIYETTGEMIETFADLSPALSAVLKLAPIAWDAGTVIGCILDITDNSAGGPMDAITDGHRTGTYVVGINAMYFGYRGQEGVSNNYYREIPACVKTIGYHCFTGSNISTLIGLDHVEYIGEEAFRDCSLLLEAKLGSVKTIGSYMFSNCTSLKMLDLAGVKSIGVKAFENCTALEELYIPDSVKELNANYGYGYYYSPFAGCTGIKIISVGGVETLTTGMLKTGSAALETLTIRGTVKTVGDKAFEQRDNDQR